MFGKVKRLIAMSRIGSMLDNIIQEWRREKPLKFYNGWTGTTVISAGIAGILVFVGNMLNWDAQKITDMSKTLTELVMYVAGTGAAGKLAGAIAAKKESGNGQ